MTERREYVRVNTAVEVTHRVDGTLLGGRYCCEDISAGGLSLPIVQKLDPGMVLNLDIFLPGSGKRLNAKGKIVWQTPFKHANGMRFLVGTKFIDISENDRNLLLNYVRFAAADKAQ